MSFTIIAKDFWFSEATGNRLELVPNYICQIPARIESVASEYQNKVSKQEKSIQRAPQLRGFVCTYNLAAQVRIQGTQSKFISI